MTTTTTIIADALRAAINMISIDRHSFASCNARPDGSISDADGLILREYDDVLALIRDAIAAMETTKPVAFITRESMMRLSNGGNDSRGTVPVHRFASAIANRPLYLHPTVPEPAR